MRWDCVQKSSQIKKSYIQMSDLKKGAVKAVGNYFEENK